MHSGQRDCLSFAHWLASLDLIELKGSPLKDGIDFVRSSVPDALMKVRGLPLHVTNGCQVID
jgi:hypothetical protein